MASPSGRLVARIQTVRVDGQGRLVIPQALREELLDVPGELMIERTSDGILLRPLSDPGRVRIAGDGLPVLELGRPITNDEVIAAIDHERNAR